MNTKKLIAGATAATVLTLGGGAAIAAQQAPETTAGETKQEQQEPSYKGSVKAPADKAENEAAEGKEGSENEAAEKKQEAAESQKLQSLAKIDQGAAEKAALGAVPGTAKAAELGNENGSVVWEVEVAAKDGTLQEVKVDAGNGQVLAQEAEGDEGSEKGEANEANEGPEANEANEAQEAGATANR